MLCAIQEKIFLYKMHLNGIKKRHTKAGNLKMSKDEVELRLTQGKSRKNRGVAVKANWL